MSDKDNMLAAIHEVPLQIMRELADLLDESGETQTAAGMRWLADHGKRPASQDTMSGTRYVARYVWREGTGNGVSGRSTLPAIAFALLDGAEWLTEGEAVLAGAVAAGRWLAGEKAPVASAMADWEELRRQLQEIMERQEQERERRRRRAVDSAEDWLQRFPNRPWRKRPQPLEADWTYRPDETTLNAKGV